MTKTTLGALICLTALGACNRDKPESGAYPANDAARRNLNPMGAPAADASFVEKAMGKLDPGDAEAKFLAAPKVTLKGEARLNQRDDGVHIDVELSEGPPGTHGIHIHQKADCSDIPGKSMGDHFAPESHPHGLPTAAAHHLGDLGNIEIGTNGAADFEIVVPRANLQKGHEHSFLNRALVIHEKRDIGTGKSGESGTPIACASIVAD